MADRDDSNVFHISALDDEFAAAFDPLKPWVFEFGDDGQECFATEDEACARQRAYREASGFDADDGVFVSGSYMTWAEYLREAYSDPMDDFNYVGSRHHY